MLPNPIIGNAPLHVWLGIFALILLLLQIGVGKGIVKIPFAYHTGLLWKILLAVVVLHAYYGLSIYFL
ncbi:MAG TPA: hypothetical protein PK263_02900 [bacterium]|nr:hypothetical protein [bacterium]